ncbi:hypothetical protein [Mameliella sediminis]|uniref:hypothetical protein n=1 Tax=Mameliella sediminis TaxID=2836866 RepID=UPI001C47F0AC|nr:hypothetical protein [Mameliella sediminis]MBY6115235.1 hypothetical protein [Antarctobacter heliothermus]MBY6144880.1 hypothetical protein [Mameliella alba]MBV7395995.1 hypothetical protein [Mameliella sediminis]MBY6160406.1 hypothetical protein [Mameliella alba]MBY6168876.1 hypothetical protein [Mameliella alba]
MTALKQFARLEATGLWRPSPEDQRREVIVSLGEATLTLSDINGTALAHWSLGAVNRANGKDLPAIYHPDNAPDETLELPASETEMIAGIDRLLRAIERRRPRPGKLRFLLTGGVFAALAAAAVFWLPGALERYAVTVVPPVKRAEIGDKLLRHIERVAGKPCNTRDARLPLEHLSARLLERGRIVILPGGAQLSAHLPGGIILLNRSVVEDHEDPDVAAGFVLTEAVRVSRTDPLAALLDHAGLVASLRLLTTGELPDNALAAYAEQVMADTPPLPPIDPLIAAFAAAEIRSSPFAYALDITGERTLPLIEADPRATEGSRQVLSDADWVRLQGICGA